MNEEVTEEQKWLNTAADCERIAAARDAQHDPESARRWREGAAEAREKARAAKELEMDECDYAPRFLPQEDGRAGICG